MCIRDRPPIISLVFVSYVQYVSQLDLWTFIYDFRYRAIFGPFRWEVWLALTLTYLLAIFPIAFSAYHTWKYIFNKPSEIENMFWYVFGTFTNLFTFTGKKAWSKTRMNATLMFIGKWNLNEILENYFSLFVYNSSTNWRYCTRVSWKVCGCLLYTSRCV